MGLYQHGASSAPKASTRSNDSERGGLQSLLRSLGYQKGRSATTPKAPSAAAFATARTDVGADAPAPDAAETAEALPAPEAGQAPEVAAAVQTTAPSEASAVDVDAAATSAPTTDTAAPDAGGEAAATAQTPDAPQTAPSGEAEAAAPTGEPTPDALRERAVALYEAGTTQVNPLTDAVFFDAHPEAQGSDLRAIGLDDDWVSIRDSVVRPVVAEHRTTSAGTSEVGMNQGVDLSAAQTLIYDTVAADPAKYAAISEADMYALSDVAFFATYPEYVGVDPATLDKAARKRFGDRYGEMKNSVVRPAVRAYYLAQTETQMAEFRAAAEKSAAQAPAAGVSAAQVYDPASGQWVTPNVVGGTVDQQLQSVWDTYKAFYQRDSNFGKAGCCWASGTTLLEMGWEPGGNTIAPAADEEGTTPLTAAENKLLRDTMESELAAGHPVQIGVDYHSGNPGNTDKRTDHWLVVLAMTKNEAGQRVFLGIDNADVDFSVITKGCAVAFAVNADGTITHAAYNSSSKNDFSANGHTIVQVRRTTGKGATPVTRTETPADEGAAPAPEAPSQAPAAEPGSQTDTTAAGIMQRFATGYYAGLYASLDEDGLGAYLAKDVVARDPALVRAVFAGLFSVDRDDVALSLVNAVPDAQLRGLDKALLRELEGYLDGSLLAWNSGVETSAADRVRAAIH